MYEVNIIKNKVEINGINTNELKVLKKEEMELKLILK